jgi:hypothetical protein
VQNGILYIGVQANDPDVLNLKRVCKANDIALIFEDDVLEIFAAPNADQPGNYYQIAVNLNQNIFDAQHSNGKGDPKWNSDAKSAGSTGKDSWTMEIALPLKSFGITDLKDEYSLRFNLCRSKCSGTQENRELQQWAPTDRSFHNFNGFGVMSIYSNPRRYENIQTYQKDLIRKIYVNTGLDGVKKTEDQQIQYLLQPTYAKVQIEYNPTKGGTGLGTICFDRFTGLEVGQDDYFEIKFRNPAPGIDCLLGYTLFDVDGTVLGDYYNVTRNNPSPSWNTSAWKIGTGGYSADKAIQEGKPWKAIKKISGVQCYFFATGATTGIDKRDFEIEYIRITKKPLKKIMLKE